MRKKWLAGALALMIGLQGILPCTVLAELETDEFISTVEEALPEEAIQVEEEILPEETGEDLLSDEEEFFEMTEEDPDAVETDADYGFVAEDTDDDLIVEEAPAEDIPEETAFDTDLQEFSDDGDAEAAASETDTATEEVDAEAELIDLLEEGDEDAGAALNEFWQDIQNAMLLSIAGGGREADSEESQILLNVLHGFFDGYASQDETAAGEPEMVGASYLTNLSHDRLRNYLKSYGTYSSDEGEYYIASQDTAEDGTIIFWSVSYSPSKNVFTFLMSGTASDGSAMLLVGMEAPYRFSSNPKIVYGEYYYDDLISLAEYTMTNRAGYNGNQTVSFKIDRATYSTTSEIQNRANKFLSNGYKLWNSLISDEVGITMLDFGFGRRDDSGPTLTLTPTSVTLLVGTSTQATLSNLSYGDGVSSWGTSDARVATVSNGKITARGAGTANITVVLKSGLRGTVKVTVITSLQPPELIAAYNGAKGIGIKFYKAANATQYVIYRKYDGIWTKIRTISATSSELEFSGNTIMYTDTTVAKNYGKGYIYSVASKNGNLESSYDKVGRAIYRLTPPTLTSASAANGTVTVTWKSVFGRTETNGNYDLQVAPYANGKAGTFKSLTKLPGFSYNIVKAIISGFNPGTYVFRIRCSKTNKDRGTYYSEYSKWLSVRVY